MQDSHTPSDKLENFSGMVNSESREAVLSKIFFFDNLDRREDPYLELTIPELTSTVWSKSYDIFEEELYQIIVFFESKCDSLKLDRRKTAKYQDHIMELFDLESLHNNEFIILRNMSEDELARISHEFRLRLQIDDLNTFVISRNLIYLTFLTLLEYVESIEEEIIYFLIILTFLMIFIIQKDLTYFSGNSETTDYSIYEIARTLSDERRIKFESLVSDSVSLYDIKQADMAVEKLIDLMFGGAMKNPGLFEEGVNKILNKLISHDSSNNDTTKYDERRKIQELMHAMDTDKVKHIPIKTQQRDSGLLVDVISSKPYPDRFKSDFKNSWLSNQMLKILVSGKNCVMDWIEKHGKNWEMNFHIHKNDFDGQFEGCDLSVTLPTLSYFSLQPEYNNEEMNIRLKQSKYKNNISNLIIQSGPNWSKLQFSPKVAISKPRTKNRVVLDSNTTVFEREERGEQTRLTIPKSVTQVFTGENTDQMNNDDLRELDVLRIMERMIQANVCNSYELSTYEERIILFLSIDADQEDYIVNKKLPSEIRKSLSILNHTDNLQIVILID